MFSDKYYNQLYAEGRPMPFLVAQEILAGTGGMGVPDPQGMPGFYLYEFGGWEMIYNPDTGEVWHLQPTN